MKESLKQKIISGMIWYGIERFGSSLFLFISNLVLARLLAPEDFGCIGILMVFVGVTNAIVDGGFDCALIQKQNPTQIDYSTIFYWNIFLSFFLYAVLFVTAPTIAKFYNTPELNSVLKVYGSILIINAFMLIQQNILKKQIKFKRLAKINLAGSVIGTCIGIIVAFYGYGVWSLVFKLLVTSLIQCGIYWIISRWTPSYVFSWGAFKSLFSFGSFVFLETVINTIYSNLLVLIIGKKFTPSILGFYSQANKMQDIPRITLSAIAINVSFPVLSSIQDDSSKLLQVLRKNMRALMYVNVPLMLLLIIIASPLFNLLFTAKWNQSIPFFQALCIMGIIYTPYEFNQNILKVMGKSKALFFVRIVQCIIGVIMVLIGMKWGVMGFVIGYVTSSYLTYIIITFVTKQLISYGLQSQIKDLLPIFLSSFISASVAYLLSLFNLHYIAMMCLQIVVFIILYIFCSKLFKVKELDEYIHILKIKL